MSVLDTSRSGWQTAKTIINKIREKAVSKPPSSPMDYFKAADGHRAAAQILEPHTGLIGSEFSSTNSIFLAFYNVLGFSVELYLKAYLATKGFSSKKLSAKPFGHDLINLRQAAVEQGLTLHHDAIKVVVESLAKNHGDYTYRYLSEGVMLHYFVKGEPITIVFATLDALHAHIHPLVSPH